MAIKTYTSPQTVRRPFRSFRFDVYSLKADRHMMLYGKAALSQFIDLEADKDVSALCERPLKIPDVKPEKCIDFWAVRNGQAHFYLLVSKSEARDAAKPKPAMEDFRDWVRDQKAVLHEVVADVFDQHQVRHANWTLILQHLVAHNKLVTSDLLERCIAKMPSSFTLPQIEAAIAEQDDMLIRAAVFTCLTRGGVKCPAIDTEYIHRNTLFVKS
jgi:hypothetical protein